MGSFAFLKYTKFIYITNVNKELHTKILIQQE